MTAQEWYEQGNAFRKESKWHEAINCYIQAIALDPDSPAVEAKRMLDDIMAFYCKDMYNPASTIARRTLHSSLASRPLSSPTDFTDFTDLLRAAANSSLFTLH